MEAIPPQVLYSHLHIFRICRPRFFRNTEGRPQRSERRSERLPLPQEEFFFWFSASISGKAVRPFYSSPAGSPPAMSFLHLIQIFPTFPTFFQMFFYQFIALPAGQSVYVTWKQIPDNLTLHLHTFSPFH